MKNQRYQNENATPRDRIASRMMPNISGGVSVEEREDVFSKYIPLAMAYVPDQKWGDVYDVETAFPKGTIFPCLDFPFIGCGKGRCMK